MRSKFLGVEGRFGVAVAVLESLFFAVGSWAAAVFVVVGFLGRGVFIVIVREVVAVGVCASSVSSRIFLELSFGEELLARFIARVSSMKNFLSGVGREVRITGTKVRFWRGRRAF